MPPPHYDFLIKVGLTLVFHSHSFLKHPPASAYSVIQVNFSSRQSLCYAVERIHICKVLGSPCLLLRFCDDAVGHHPSSQLSVSISKIRTHRTRWGNVLSFRLYAPSIKIPIVLRILIGSLVIVGHSWPGTIQNYHDGILSRRPWAYYLYTIVTDERSFNSMIIYKVFFMSYSRYRRHPHLA